MKKLCLMMLAAITAGCTPLAADYENAYASSVRAKRKSVSAARSQSAPADRMALAGSNGSFFRAEAGRQMAYTAGFTLQVKLASAAHGEVKKLAESLGGYLVSSRNNNMKIKIPVEKADEFLNTVKKSGKLRNFHISAEDLTDTITDLNVRLDNLKKFRTRLTELLSKTLRVEEILKIERELNRITTEMERLTAQLQNNRTRVDFVTFEVKLLEQHGALPGGNPAAVANFGFLQLFADDKIAGNEDEPLFGLDIPAGFVATRTGKIVAQDVFAATSADDCIFRTWETDIPAESTLKFWEQLVCRALNIYNGYGNIKAEAVKFNGADAVKITADVLTDSGVLKYLTVISVKRHKICDDELQVIEFFGPEAAFEKNLKTVTTLIQK